jgi:signal transduction histidine kinase
MTASPTGGRPASTGGGHAGSAGSRALLEAVVAISSDLDLHSVLVRIVQSACELTAAQYGALGVLAPDGRLQEFVTHGMEPELVERIGELPHGRGILGAVITDPRPLRLTDLTRHPASYGFPRHHPPMKTFLGVPITVQGEVFGNLYLTEKAEGSAFTDGDQQSVLALAGAAGYVIGNARAYQLSERRRQWLEATGRISDALQPPISLDDALREIGHTLRAVSGARAVALLHPAEGQGLRLDAVDGPDAARVTALVAQLGDRLQSSGRSGDTFRVDTDGDPWWILSATVQPALAPSLLLLIAFASEDRVEDVQERRLLESFIDHVALALDRAQALEDRAQLAILSERDRIARDLHDLVIQRLFATGMGLQGMSMLAERDEFKAGLSRAVDDIDVTIKDIRSTIFELRTHEEATLRTDVGALLREYTPLLGFRPEFRTSGPVDTAVPDDVQRELLAVLREALSNIVRHAGARSAAVEIEVADSMVALHVRDDGVGVQPGRRESGLLNARTRAAALAGSFELVAGRPRGTHLTWRASLS